MERSNGIPMEIFRLGHVMRCGVFNIEEYALLRPSRPGLIFNKLYLRVMEIYNRSDFSTE